jgi:molybdopterin/thiamine biosynthesis adenylyltransferase
MKDEQLLRYSRQILLPQIDIEGQEALLSATVLIVGLGGLGSPAALYLASAGVGTLVLNDFDVVDLSNLQRQIVHQQSAIGTSKVDSAAQTLSTLNSDTHLIPLHKKLDEASLTRLLNTINVVLDCSDNFDTRFLLNAACHRSGIPLISGAAIRFEGQITVFDFRDANSPCYNCIYEQNSEVGEACAQNGVVAPLPGIIGTMQALEALKVISGAGNTLTHRLLLLDALTLETRTIEYDRNPNCLTCGQKI